MKTYKIKLSNGSIETVHQTSLMRASVEVKNKFGRREARLFGLISITK